MHVTISFFLAFPSESFIIQMECSVSFANFGNFACQSFVAFCVILYLCMNVRTLDTPYLHEGTSCVNPPVVYNLEYRVYCDTLVVLGSSHWHSTKRW